MKKDNTLFVRAEAVMQCYVLTNKHHGSNPHISTQKYPSKSAFVGMLAGAMGTRRNNSVEPLAVLNSLTMGVRIDQEGEIMEDFQTAGPPLMTADGNISTNQSGDLLTGKINVRQYITNASFLVVFQGDPDIIDKCAEALENPIFPPYYGRKFCIPLLPPFDGTGDFATIEEAMASRNAVGWNPGKRHAVIERKLPNKNTVSCRDVLLNCNPLVHGSRLIEHIIVPVTPMNVSLACMTHPSKRKKETEHTTKIKNARKAKDNWLCLVCKMRAEESHHVTYARYGKEDIEDLRSLCEVCHRATTGLEYELGMVSDRIDPIIPYWKDRILSIRSQFTRIKKGKK